MNKINSKTTLLVFMFLLGFLNNFAARVHGFEPDYAGQSLTFFTYSDPITKNEIETFKIAIDSKGHFQSTFEINETIFCHSNFDIYSGILIVNANSDIKIKLPPRREKTILESKNPYFKPLNIWIKVQSTNKSEINNLVYKLEHRYIQLTDKYFNQLYYRKSQTHFDTIKTILQNEFQNSGSQILNNQVNFKLKLLASDINGKNQKTVLKELNPANFSFTNPAFMDLFDLIFSNKLSFEANSISGKKLRTAVNSGNITFIQSFFKEKYSLTSKFTDIALLKILHDAFYSNQFSKKAILAMLENPLFSENNNKNIRKTAILVKQKLLHLMPGTKAPVITLFNIDGKKENSNKLQGIKYLFFVDTEMLVCREHLKYLATIVKKFEGHLNLFIIIKHSDKKEIQDFFAKNEINGIKVIEESENKYGKDYNVKSYPTGFLLNENHEIILSPAKNPLDGFEQEFSTILRNRHLQNLRNQK